MKLATFLKRTEKIAKQSNGFKNALKLLTNGGQVRMCHTSGSGRYTTNIDSTNQTIAVLTLAGLTETIDYDLKNDSARGGLTGNYIELTSSGKRKMINKNEDN